MQYWKHYLYKIILLAIKKACHVDDRLFCVKEIIFYFDLIAITGSILAATQAGTIPDKMPIKLEISNPLLIFEKVNWSGSASCGI